MHGIQKVFYTRKKSAFGLCQFSTNILRDPQISFLEESELDMDMDVHNE